MPSKVYVGLAHLTFDNVLNPNVDVLLEQLDAKILVLTFSTAVIAPNGYTYIGVVFPKTQLIFKGTVVGKDECAAWTCLRFEAHARDSDKHYGIRFI